MINVHRMGKLFAVVGLMALLGACASPARMNAMIAERTAETTISESSPLLNAITLEGVSGGESTNPLWTSEVGNPEFRAALRSSLANHAILARSGGKYQLKAYLLGLDQPFFGASFTVTAKVRYEILEKASRKQIMNEVVTTPYTATFSDAFLGVERLRLANEGAIRENISAFIQHLVSVSKDFSSRYIHQFMSTFASPASKRAG